MKPFSSIVDIIILDGGSTDHSLEPHFLKSNGVRAILTKKEKGTQLRMGFAYALGQRYEGIITIDGNGKDSVDSIPIFIEQLNKGMDFIQGSRYMKGGTEINNPLSRKLAIKLIRSSITAIPIYF